MNNTEAIAILVRATSERISLDLRMDDDRAIKEAIETLRLNLDEDARIERLINSEYPGLRSYLDVMKGVKTMLRESEK